MDTQNQTMQRGKPARTQKNVAVPSTGATGQPLAKSSTQPQAKPVSGPQTTGQMPVKKCMRGLWFAIGLIVGALIVLAVYNFF